MLKLYNKMQMSITLANLKILDIFCSDNTQYMLFSLFTSCSLSIVKLNTSTELFWL